MPFQPGQYSRLSIIHLSIKILVYLFCVTFRFTYIFFHTRIFIAVNIPFIALFAKFLLPYIVSISRLIHPRVQLILPLVVHKPRPLLLMHTGTFYSFQSGIMHVGWANTQCSTRTWLGFMLLRITTISEITVGSNNHPWSRSLTCILKECDFWSIDKHLTDLLMCFMNFCNSLQNQST